MTEHKDHAKEAKEARDAFVARTLPHEPFWGEDEKHFVGDPLSQMTVPQQRIVKGRHTTEYRPTDDPFRPRGPLHENEAVALDPVKPEEETPAGRVSGRPGVDEPDKAEVKAHDKAAEKARKLNDERAQQETGGR